MGARDRNILKLDGADAHHGGDKDRGDDREPPGVKDNKSGPPEAGGAYGASAGEEDFGRKGSLVNHNRPPPYVFHRC
jgi:hypothetical protein